MNIKDYYEKKKELEYLITYNERIHCPRVAEKWRRELSRLCVSIWRNVGREGTISAWHDVNTSYRK